MTAVFERFSADDGELRADVLVQPAINYALVHNRVPLVRHLSLRNLGRQPVADVELTLELTGPDGPLATPWVRGIASKIAPDAVITLDDFAEFIPDRARLSSTDEAFGVVYRLTVTRPDHPDLRLNVPSNVLAHNEWFNNPAVFDSLAAFVQPNTRTVEAVLRSASAVLAEHTGSGSLDGYESGPQRAALIAGAVYQAFRGLDLAYQRTSASFEDTGQKVRTTAALLSARLGDCVDLSVAYAACLEAAGLHPLIWLADGHAFAGFLTDSQRLGSTVITEQNLIISMVESGKAVPVEPTGMVAGGMVADGMDSTNGIDSTSGIDSTVGSDCTGGMDFADAVTAGLAHFRARDRLRAVIDVHLAHRSGVRPLPSADLIAPSSALDGGAGRPGSGTRPLGSIELPDGVARTRMGEHGSEDLPEPPDDAPPRVRKWKKALLDLSLRNPLLNLPSRGKGLDLHVPVGCLPVLDDLIHDGKPVLVLPQDDISHLHELAGARRAQDLDEQILAQELRTDRRIYGAVTEVKYQATMRALQRDARTMEQETGSNYLYLTIGTLVHAKSSGAEAHAPLFLLPVRIEGGAGRRPYQLVVDGNETASPNHCLIEWLRVKHGVRIPELEQPATDEHGIDLPKTLAAINERLMHNRLNYRLDETASLRLLQFATFQMWRDLNDHWPVFMQNPVVRHLVEYTGASFDDPAGNDLDPQVDEANLHLPIPADGSQMQAVVMAERGQSFVLEGPPGTGKSQTITNLIAQAVLAGRSVLFVAEKQAALDVVKRRLKQIGLGSFVLDLHGRKQSRNAIRQQLRTAIDEQDRGNDAAWEAAESAYRGRLAPLAEYPRQLHTENPAGLSAWSAYENVLAFGEGPTTTVPPVHLSADGGLRQQVQAALRELPTAARSARLRPEHPWSLSGRRSIAGMDAAAVVAAADELERVRAELRQRPTVAALLHTLAAPTGIERLLPAARLAAHRRLPDRATTLRAGDPAWDEAVARLRAGLAGFRQAYAVELAAFQPEAFTAAPVAAWHAEAVQAGQRLLHIGTGKRLRAIAGHLVAYQRTGTPIAAEQVEASLARLVSAQLDAAALHRQAVAVEGLGLPAGWLPCGADAPEQLASAWQRLAVSRELLAGNGAARSILEAGLDPQDLSLLERADAAWQGWRALLAYGPDELNIWAGPDGWLAAWQRDGATWCSQSRDDGLFPLQRWSHLLQYADVLDLAGLDVLRTDLLRGAIPADEAEQAYRRALARTSLSERMQYGGLTYFDHFVHERHVGQYQEAAGRLREELPDRMPSMLVRRRPFNTAERRGRFAEFTAELRRQRGGRQFRELFREYPDIVLGLTPCVLVSPASAANFLAPDATTFDVVIFDEASQIRVAEAVGAMGRGRSAVVVGDSKQMPPTSVMHASTTDEQGLDDEDEDGPVPEDLDSILSESVESGLPQRWLSWHYRSHDESLISFSNRHYYDGKLSTLPSPGGTAAIVWHRIDGRFDRGGARTNQVEAAAIVAEIGRRLADPATAQQSVGVVTFNIQQRDLILNLLEESTDPLIRDRMSNTPAEPLFVKNLENVQGDERDVILFSLAFSVNPDTGLLPLNFGPLSQTGGERRLNVAITRARRLVMLFASFNPADIDLTRTNAVGTHHLRAYCELAAAGSGFDGLVDARAQRRDLVRDEVAARIRARGHEVRTGHGLSDFTVDIAVRAAGASRWQVAVMLDGPQWSKRPTVADRDAAPELLSTIMDWPEVVRFWLPAWLNDPEGVIDRIDQAVTRAAGAGRRRHRCR